MWHIFKLYHYLLRRPGVNLTRNKIGFTLTFLATNEGWDQYLPTVLSVGIKAKDMKSRTRVDIRRT